MIIASLLLTEEDYYIDDRKQLPHRPTFDKELLKALISLNTITKDAYDILPASIQKTTTVTLKEPSMAIKISEIDALADLLIIIRSTRKVHGGKKFRLDKFRCLARPGQIELWVRKETK